MPWPKYTIVLDVMEITIALIYKENNMALVYH
jgi:hypothetical protein